MPQIVTSKLIISCAMARFRGNTVDGMFYYMHIIMSIKGMNIFVVNLNGDIYIRIEL